MPSTTGLALSLQACPDPTGLLGLNRCYGADMPDQGETVMPLSHSESIVASSSLIVESRGRKQPNCSSGACFGIPLYSPANHEYTIHLYRSAHFGKSGSPCTRIVWFRWPGLPAR